MKLLNSAGLVFTVVLMAMVIDCGLLSAQQDDSVPPVDVKSSEARRLPLIHKGHVADKDKDLERLVIHKLLHHSLILHQVHLEDWLVESGLPFGKVEDVMSRLNDRRREIEHEIQSAATTSKAIEVTESERLKYSRDAEKISFKSETDLVEDIASILTEREFNVLAGVVFQKYSYLEILHHPLAVSVLDLSDKQVSVLKQVAETRRVTKEKLLEGASPSVAEERMKKDERNFLQSVFRAQRLLTLDQLRKFETLAGRLKPGQRWSKWLEQFPEEHRERIINGVPVIKAAVDAESKSGVLIAP